MTDKHTQSRWDEMAARGYDANRASQLMKVTCTEARRQLADATIRLISARKAADRQLRSNWPYHQLRAGARLIGGAQ